MFFRVTWTPRCPVAIGLGLPVAYNEFGEYTRDLPKFDDPPLVGHRREGVGDQIACLRLRPMIRAERPHVHGHR